jgi:hypothetical protein
MAKRRSSFQPVIDWIDWLGDKCLKIGAIVLPIVAAYLIWGMLSGGLANWDVLSHNDRVRVLANVELACKLVFISGILFTFGVAVRFRHEESTGYILAIVGFALFFGTPKLVAVLYQFKKLAGNQALSLVVNRLSTLGLTFLVPGVILSLWDVAYKVRNQLISQRPTGKLLWGEEAQNKKRPMYGSCWDMTFCREFVRNYCPAYSANKPCWKVKQGCYCDEKTILQALKYQDGSGAFGQQLAYEYQAKKESMLTAAQKRARCKSCIIYNEHERQKYKLLSPAVIVGVIVAIWQAYPAMQTYFMKLMVVTEQLARKMSFAPQSTVPVLPSSYITGDGSHTVFVLFVIWLSIIVLSYALRILEYCIFKLKI